MQTIDHNKLVDLIDFVVVKHREPLFVWGSPGIGKSEAIAQAADRHNAVLVDIRLGQYDSVDLRGIPVPNMEQNQTIWYAPATLPFKGNPNFTEDPDRPIFIFFDEMNGASQSVAGVAYQIVNDRRCGEHVLMDNVYIIAAGNREGDKGVTIKQPLPLSNRFTHAELVAMVDAFIENYAIPRGLPPILMAFLKFKEGNLNTFDPSRSDKAFATPRSIARAMRYFEDDSIPESVRWTAMEGSVGSGWVAEFKGFLEVWQKVVPIKAILADPTGVRLPDELSMTYAQAVSVSGAMSMQTIKPLYRYLQRLDPEYTVMAFKMALKRDEELFDSAEFDHFAQQYKTLFRPQR